MTSFMHHDYAVKTGPHDWAYHCDPTVGGNVWVILPDIFKIGSLLSGEKMISVLVKE